METGEIKNIPRYFLDEFKEQRADYLILVFGFGGGLAAFFYFSGQDSVKVVIVLALALFYLLWGIIHHASKKDLHLKVILEYLLISLLGLVVFFCLRKRI